MIGNSIYEYVFIRVCIFFLHWIAPVSLLSYPATFIINSLESSIPFPLKAWINLEAAFFLLVYLPRSYYLQRAAIHPEPLSLEDRRLLFNRCNSHIYDPEYYLTKWFKDAPTSEIKRENVKSFLRWAFLNTDEIRVEDEEELEEYADAMEKLLGRKLQPGVGNARCLKLTLDKVDMLHRSLFWYFCVFLVDTLTSGYMCYHGFYYYRTSLRRFFSIFPFRPHNLYAWQRSPSRMLTYWHRPHTSRTKLPVFFIHGIGIGLYPYVAFLAEINEAAGADGEDDGQVGIIAVEIMPISLRITSPALRTDEMCMEINTILETHGWDNYGSILCTHLLHNPHIANKIGPILLIDPVSFLLHLPNVAYNFICRTPVHANEHLLHYFGSKDMGVAHTLSRRFFWSENILWKEDIRDRPVTAVLSGRDLIVDTETVGAYLANVDTATPNEGEWKKEEWKGSGLEMLWFGKLDHGQVFNSKQHRKRLVTILRMYCAETMLNKA